jgi:hypothetical protein
VTEDQVTETPTIAPETFASIVVPAAGQAEAQTIAAGFPGGEGMFTTGCSADGAPPASYYISSGSMDAGIPLALADVPGIVISDLPPFTLLADLGLQLVSDAEPTDA